MMPQLDMPEVARREFGIEAIELVNTMLASPEPDYVRQLAQNALEHDVRILLIMVDREGAIAAADKAEREEAVKRHAKWVDVAEYLGGHSIRLNWHGAEPETMKNAKMCKAVVDRSVGPLRTLCDYADKRNVNVLIENHGGPSSYPQALLQLMSAVDHERFGTLPDFGNFPEDVDRYLATDLLMNHAKAVSAKCMDFDDATGAETTMDYGRLIEIVVDKHGYDRYIGIEYGGSRLSEFDGIKACKRLLESMQ